MAAAVPKPLATAACEVTHDPTTGSLLVRPGKVAGWAGLLWRRGHQAMVEQAGSFRQPAVWAHGARGVAERDGWLRFQLSDTNYRRLTSTPDLSAIVTVDREAGRILGVRFRTRGA